MDKIFFKSWVLRIPHRFEGSSLDGESLIFSWSHFLFSYYQSSFFFLCVLFLESAESNHFLLAHIPRMNESHDPRRPFKEAITTSAFSTFSSTTTSCSLIWEMTVWSLHSGSSHSSTGFLRSHSNLCSSLQISWSRNQTSLSVSLGNTLVVQFDLWLNQQWSSWPWPSSFGVRLWASSPSGTRTSLLM